MNYLTPETAKELCIKAHAGQWRKATPIITKEDYLKYKEAIDYLGPNTNATYELKDNTRIFTKPVNQWFVEKPYSSHPIAVADMLSTDDEKIVAYLHDVIEYTDWQLFPFDGLWLQHPKDTINRIPLPKNIYTALHKLTKWEIDGKSYSDYIKGLSDNRLATKVKIADMFHNMSTSISDKQKAKYIKYIHILLAQI